VWGGGGTGSLRVGVGAGWGPLRIHKTDHVAVPSAMPSSSRYPQRCMHACTYPVSVPVLVPVSVSVLLPMRVWCVCGWRVTDAVALGLDVDEVGHLHAVRAAHGQVPPRDHMTEKDGLLPNNHVARLVDRLPAVQLDLVGYTHTHQRSAHTEIGRHTDTHRGRLRASTDTHAHALDIVS
jgi:hypothetical protein